MSIWNFADLLPEMPEEARISLGEGHTPLVRSRRIGPAASLPNLYFKLETVNPTGSYKDRFAASAVSELRHRKSQVCLATSSGNTGSSLAAYCAAAGIRCLIAIIEGTPEGKLRQMQAYGAQVFTVNNFGLNEKVSTAIFNELKRQADNYNSPVQISAFKHSPVGMSGVQTISYELAEQLSTQKMHLFSPAGGGGLTLAVAFGFRKLAETQTGFLSPRVHCVQPEGNDTMAGPLRRGEEFGRSIPHSTTAVGGLQVPGVIDGNEVVRFCRESGGTGHLITDEQAFEVQQMLAQQEGIYCEPAGAVALAGALSAVKKGELDPQSNIVCLVTGIGFKDPDSTLNMTKNADCPMLESPEDIDEFLHQMI